MLLKIFKINAKFSYLLMTVGVNSIFCTACLLLALLCALGLTGGLVWLVAF